MSCTLPLVLFSVVEVTPSTLGFSFHSSCWSHALYPLPYIVQLQSGKEFLSCKRKNNFPPCRGTIYYYWSSDRTAGGPTGPTTWSAGVRGGCGELATAWGQGVARARGTGQVGVAGVYPLPGPGQRPIRVEPWGTG
jgi:hypothetical protein